MAWTRSCPRSRWRRRSFWRWAGASRRKHALGFFPQTEKSVEEIRPNLIHLDRVLDEKRGTHERLHETDPQHGRLGADPGLELAELWNRSGLDRQEIAEAQDHLRGREIQHLLQAIVEDGKLLLSEG